jgi:hypothetical protein
MYISSFFKKNKNKNGPITLRPDSDLIDLTLIMGLIGSFLILSITFGYYLSANSTRLFEIISNQYSSSVLVLRRDFRLPILLKKLNNLPSIFLNCFEMSVKYLDTLIEKYARSFLGKGEAVIDGLRIIYSYIKSLAFKPKPMFEETILKRPRKLLRNVMRNFTKLFIKLFKRDTILYIIEAIDSTCESIMEAYLHLRIFDNTRVLFIRYQNFLTNLFNNGMSSLTLFDGTGIVLVQLSFIICLIFLCLVGTFFGIFLQRFVSKRKRKKSIKLIEYLVPFAIAFLTQSFRETFNNYESIRKILDEIAEGTWVPGPIPTPVRLEQIGQSDIMRHTVEEIFKPEKVVIYVPFENVPFEDVRFDDEFTVEFFEFPTLPVDNFEKL